MTAEIFPRRVGVRAFIKLYANFFRW